MSSASAMPLSFIAQHSLERARAATRDDLDTFLLPKEQVVPWTALVGEFGLPLRAAKKTAANVPVLLVRLEEELSRAGGYAEKGIFRIEPDAKVLKLAHDSLDAGTFDGSDMPHVIASLIKQYLRSIPGRLLGHVTIERAKELAALEPLRAYGLVMKTEAHPGCEVVLDWLWGVCRKVLDLRASNRMSSKALGVVFAPNLGPEASAVDSRDAMSMMQACQVWARLLEVLIAGACESCADG